MKRKIDRTTFLIFSQIESIEKVFDFAKQLKTQERTQTYVLADQPTISSSPTPVTPAPAIDKHPTRCTIHLPADLSKSNDF